MSAIAKSKLKLLIKECLLEILAEGVGEMPALVEARTERRVRESVQPQQRRTAPAKKPRPVVLDEAFLDEIAPDRLKIAAGGNPVLASIMADTAKTTFRENASHFATGEVIAGQAVDSVSALGGTSAPGMTPEAARMAQIEPEALFGEDVVSRWAALAEKPKAFK